MSNLLNVSSSPHVRFKLSTRMIMMMVIIALLPTTIFGIINFGPYALLLIVLTIAACVCSEAIFNKIVKKEQTIGDLSAVLTGLLLALNFPASLPWWMAIMGGVFAIIVVKCLFGGLGQNFMNPALGGRAFLVVAFAAQMTKFTASRFSDIDAFTGATPLQLIRSGETYNVLDMFIGNTSGTIGETSALCLLIGGIFLILVHIVDWRIPVFYIGTFVVFMLIFGCGVNGHTDVGTYILQQLFGGGLFLGAFFMATDYVTSPITPKGRILFGICVGALTGLFRCFGANAEGVSFAIIICNILVPLIEKATVPLAFGLVKEGKKNE